MIVINSTFTSEYNATLVLHKEKIRRKEKRLRITREKIKQKVSQKNGLEFCCSPLVFLFYPTSLRIGISSSL
jgi:hypothetical protein